MSQREPLVLRVHNYCPCEGHNSQIKRFLKKHYGFPKESIDEGELYNGKVSMMRDVDANKLREDLKRYLHKEVTIEKDPKKGSSNPNTSEAQLNNQLRNMSIQNGQMNQISQPWARYGQMNQISQHPIGQRRWGQTGGQFGQMGQHSRSQYPRGQIEANCGQVEQSGHHPMGGGYNQESLWNHFSDDNVNGCTIM